MHLNVEVSVGKCAAVACKLLSPVRLEDLRMLYLVVTRRIFHQMPATS